MVEALKEKISSNTNTILIGLNVLLVALIATVGFMGKDIYGEVRAYPNTAIQVDMKQVRGELDEKADKDNINVMVNELRGQFDRLYEEVCRQNDKIDELNIYLRNRGGKDG